MEATFSDRAHRYATDVVAGKIVASKWIVMAAQRHLDDLKRTDSRWHFDADKANKVCSWMETHTLPEGESPFVLQPFQVWLTCNLMGWMDDAGNRKYIEAFILIAKGNGKSPWAALLGLWLAFFDGGPRNAEVYCGAVSLEQAMTVFRSAISFVEQQPAYTRLGIQAQKRSIFSRSGARFQPVIGRGRHGARPYGAINDELHQALSSDLYDTLKTGCNKVPNSLLVTISTAGVASLENPCHQLQLRAQKALEGSLPDDRLFAAIFAADDTVDWTSEAALKMANPGLGTIIAAPEKIRKAVEDAARNPAHQNNVKAMHLNIWSTAAASWMNMQSWQACYDPDLTEESVKELPCYLGFDLARKVDLTAVVRVHRQVIDSKVHYYAFCRAYLPEAKVNLPENNHYKKWVQQGHLIATPGSEVDFNQVELDALDDIARYHVAEIRPDDKYAVHMMQNLETATGVTRKESIIPAEFSPAMVELEAAVNSGRFHHDGNPLLTWCVSNLTTYERRDGSYSMPDKEKPDLRIDAGIALLIAMSRASVGSETEQASSDPAAYFMVI